MTSAVPYDPDDFDNNPFAETGIISSINYQTTASNEGEQAGTGSPNLSNDQQLDSSSKDDVQSSVCGPVSSDSGTPADLASSPVSNFNGHPTKEELKKYVPERANKDKYQMIIKIQEIESNGQNTARNPIFRFNAKVVKLAGYRKEIYKSVRRTYKELESLYKFLMYNNIEVFIPALPNVPTLYTAMSPEFVSLTTSYFQDWFNRICNNPILIRNKEFVLFFESNDFSYTSSKTKPSTNSVIATGLKRKTLKQFNPPYDSCEPLARYRPMIKEVHLSSSKLLEKLDKYLKSHRQSAYYNNDFISSLSDLGDLEIAHDMTKLWSKFKKFSVMLNETDLIKNLNFISELMDYFRQVSDDTYNIKEALTNRHLLMRELINAEEATKKKHAVITKLKMKTQIDPIKVDEAIRSLELSNNYEKELRFQVKRTTYEMLVESQEYLNYLISRSKRLFKIIAKQQILQERKKLNLLINNRLINQQDSLSRLGRENLSEPLSTTSNNELTSNGDSWNSRRKKNYSQDLDETEADEETQCDTVSKTSNVNIKEQISTVNAKTAASLLSGTNF